MSTNTRKQNLSIADYTSAIENENNKLFDLLLEKRINPNKTKTTHPLFLTIYSNKPIYCKKLLATFKISPTIRDYSNGYRSILHAILNKITPDTMTFIDLFEKDIPMLINLTDIFGQHPIKCIYNKINIDEEKMIQVFPILQQILLKLLNYPHISLNKGTIPPLFSLMNDYIKTFYVNEIRTNMFIEFFKITLNNVLDTPKFNPNLIVRSVSEGTFLNYVCSLGLVDLVEQLLKSPALDINVTFRKTTPLHVIVKILCAKRKPELSDEDVHNYHKIYQLISTNPKFKNLNNKDSNGKSILKLAIVNKNVELIKFILKNVLDHKLDLNLDPLLTLFAKKNNLSSITTVEQAYRYFTSNNIEDIAEMFNLSFQPPVHADKYHILFLQKISVQHKVWITEKADGIYSNSVPLKTCPDLHSKITGEIHIEAEWMPTLNLYLVFNIITPGMMHLNYWERLNWLRGVHTHSTSSSTPNAIHSSLHGSYSYQHEIKALGEYLEETKNQTLPRWWVKMVFTTSDLLRFLKMQKIFEDDYSYDNGVYSNDGIIVVPEISNPLLHEKLGVIAKIKPNSHNTIDLLWGNEDYTIQRKFMTRENEIIHNVTVDEEAEQNYKKGVWRCYWNKNLQTWFPKDYRPEKKEANPLNIVKLVESYHLHPITEQELTNMYNSAPYYSKYKVLCVVMIDNDNDNDPENDTIGHILSHKSSERNKNIKQFLTTQRDAQSKFIKDNLNFHTTNISQHKWLDLGFGNTAFKKDNIWSLFSTNIQWSGVELDPNVIWATRKLYPDGNWLCGDFGSHKYDPLLENKAKNSFQGVITINTAHFATISENKWSNFRSQIDNLVEVNGYWVMIFLDADLLTSMFKMVTRIDITDTENIRINKSILPSPAPVSDLTLEYYYSWVHSEKMTEQVISFTKLRENIHTQWSIVKSVTITDLFSLEKSNENNENLLKYQKCWRYLILQKL